jgi:hypothetical protein
MQFNINNALTRIQEECSPNGMELGISCNMVEFYEIIKVISRRASIDNGVNLRRPNFTMDVKFLETFINMHLADCDYEIRIERKGDDWISVEYVQVRGDYMRKTE